MSPANTLRGESAVARFVKLSVLLTAILLAPVVLGGCSSGFIAQGDGGTPAPTLSGYAPTNGLTQSHSGGSVTIDVKWMGADETTLTFTVAMNTHSVALDGYDLGELAVLRDDTGEEYHPISWESAPGGHHRNGSLVFQLPSAMMRGEARFLELTISDIAGVNERNLRWELE